MAKFKSVNRNGLTWLAVDFLDKRIFLHPMGKTGQCQRWAGERQSEPAPVDPIEELWDLLKCVWVDSRDDQPAVAVLREYVEGLEK